MKATTKEQKKIICLSERMKGISSAAKEWGYKNLFQAVGIYYKSGHVTCMCCGHGTDLDAQELAVTLGCVSYTCPKCGRALKLEHWKGRKVKNIEACEMVVPQVFEGYQVLRVFELERDNSQSPTRYECNEEWQCWLSPDGKETIIGRDYCRTFYSLVWKFNTKMSVKRHNASANGYYAFNDMFATYGLAFYPHGGITRLLRRNGLTSELFRTHGIDAMKVMRELITMKDSFVEELVKTKQYSMLSYWLGTGGPNSDRRRWQHAIRICERNNYIVTDASLYLDYIELLQHFGKDTHNAKYVCPADLKHEHDKLQERKRKEDERALEEQQRAEAITMQEQFTKRRGVFFGLAMAAEGMHIEPLKRVEDFVDEGQAMHHCVAANRYYDMKRHPDSLIMSAKDDEGNRLETVEVNIKTGTIIQSRGVYNGVSSRHDDIVRLVTNYMPEIMRTAKTINQ